MKGAGPGVNTHKSVTDCMVVGCERVAIYRLGRKGKWRGYCSKHRAFVKPPDNYGEALASWLEQERVS